MRSLLNFTKGILVSLVLMTLVNCATIYGDNNHEVYIDTTPTRARVLVDGVYYGKTPIYLVLPYVNPNGPKILLEKTGFESILLVIPSRVQKVALWNYLFPPAFLVDYGDDYLYSIIPGFYKFNINFDSGEILVRHKIDNDIESEADIIGGSYVYDEYTNKLKFVRSVSQVEFNGKKNNQRDVPVRVLDESEIAHDIISTENIKYE